MQTVTIHPHCTHSRVLAIDPGWSNMGVAMLEGKEVVFKKVYKLGSKQLNKTDSNGRLLAIEDFVLKVMTDTGYPDKETVVVIENQMRRAMDKIAWFIGGWFRGKGYTVHYVSPLAVKNCFNIGTGNYRNNKDMAVLFTGVEDHNEADAVLLALYANVKGIFQIKLST